MRFGRGVCMRALPPLRVEGGCAAGHPAHWDPPEEQHTLILSVSTIPREPSRPFAQSLRPRLGLGGLLDAYAGPRPCGPCFGVGRWLGGSEHLTGVPTAPRPVPLHSMDARFVVKASKRASHVKSLWLLVPEPQLI